MPNLEILDFFKKTMLDDEIKFKEVDKSDIKFLYQHLKERDPITRISHKKMPTFVQHEKFVLSHPYTKWYIISQKNKKIGSVYLTEMNEIGLFLKKDVQGKGLGQKSLKLLMKLNPRNRYLANVSQKNKNSIQFFKKNKFKQIQNTYEFEP
jgi:RimJ/RimL family protein N-acetyltransferase